MIEAKPCPFCGSDAKFDNGFVPFESVYYAWCSNTTRCPNFLEPPLTLEKWNERITK